MVYENKQDWPKKYDIHKLVTREKDINKLINGEKTSVRRNDRYADPNDEIELNRKTFIIKNVYPQKLRDMTDEMAIEEGYSNLEVYKEALKSIHSGAVWNPEQVVWTHEFKLK